MDGSLNSKSCKVQSLPFISHQMVLSLLLLTWIPHIIFHLQLNESLCIWSVWRWMLYYPIYSQSGQILCYIHMQQAISRSFILYSSYFTHEEALKIDSAVFPCKAGLLYINMNRDVLGHQSGMEVWHYCYQREKCQPVAERPKHSWCKWYYSLYSLHIQYKHTSWHAIMFMLIWAHCEADWLYCVFQSFYSYSFYLSLFILKNVSRTFDKIFWLKDVCLVIYN